MAIHAGSSPAPATNFKGKIMNEIEKIEDAIENRISEIGDDVLQSLWLEFLTKKRENNERFLQRLEQKDPVLVGGMIGALIGSLLK